MPGATTRKVTLVNASDNARPTIDFQRSVAVVIGINDYGNGIPPLRTAQADAQRLAQILDEHHGYETVLLTDNVSGNRLSALLQDELPQLIGKDDRLLFYFAGHGIALDGDDGPAGYLVPQDAQINVRDSFLPMQIVHDALTALACRHCLVILDCCFSGAFRWAAMRSATELPKTLYRERYERFLRSPAWQVLTSAAYDQEALDVIVGGGFGTRSAQVAQSAARDHSPFALALFDALTGSGPTSSDANGDGVVAATELYLHLRDVVETRAKAEARHWQTPGLWPLQKHDKGEYIFLLGEPDLPPAPALTAENNPYRGLKSYNADDAELFFGRTALVKELAALVEANPLTVVLGASGTGKSSVVKAGVAPYLTGSADREGEQQDVAANGAGHTDEPIVWRALEPLRPTETPLLALAELVAEHVPGASEAPGTLPPEVYIETALTNWLSAHTKQNLLLIVDQFEELVTLCRDEQEREAFQRLLQRLLDQHPDQLHIVLTLRTDFEPQFAESPLAVRWQQGRFVVPPMTQADLREVIEGPAGVRVLFFEPPELVDTLIDEVIQTPGALPLLSFTLEQLYLKYLKRQETAQAVGDTIERALTRADYDELGGVIGSLRTRADEEYSALPDDAHRATMERVMLRMVAVEGGELARRRVPMAELVYPSAEENARVATVIERLVDARLLVMNSADADGDGVADAHVEPAHDALVRAWDRLRQWQLVTEEELPLALHRNLTQIAGDWVRADEKARNGLLWNENPWLPQLAERILPEAGERIDALSYWLDPSLLLRILVQVTTKPTRFNQQETTFIQQSARRRTFLWRRLVGITLAVMVILAGIAIYAVIQQQEAVRQTGIAQENEATAIAETKRADANAEEANQQRDEASIQRDNAVAAEATAVAEAARAEEQTRRALNESSIARSALSTNALADGDTELALTLAIEAGRASDTPESFSAIRSAINQPVHSQRVFYGRKDSRARWSPNKSKILVHSANSFALWDAKNGNELIKLQVDDIDLAQWSNDESKILIVEEDDKTASIWDVVSGNELVRLQGHTDHIYEATWSPDVSKILTRSADKTARIWDAGTGNELLVIPDAWWAKWSQDASKILTRSADKTVHIRDTNTGEELAITQDASWVVLSPDASKILARSSTDNTVRIWDTRTGEELVTIQGDPGPGNLFWLEGAVLGAILWSPDASKIFARNSNDNIAHIWDTTTGKKVADLDPFYTPNEWVQILWSPDAKRIFSRTFIDYTSQIWDAETGEELITIQQVWNATWSLDASKILTTECEERFNSDCLLGSAQIRDAENGNKLISFREDNLGWFWYAKWSPNESQILTHSENVIHIWDVKNGRELATLPDVSSVEWGQDESQILTSSDNGNVRLWHLERGHEFISIQDASSAEWSSDGSKIFVQSQDDATFFVWDAKSGEQIVVIKDILWVEWLPDKPKIVAFSSKDNTIGIWNADSGEELFLLQGDIDISRIELSPNGSQILIFSSEDNTIGIWDADSGKKLFLFQGDIDVSRAEWSPDGSQILVRSRGEGTYSSEDDIIGIWDVERGEQLITLQGASPAVWSPGGSILYTYISKDDTVSIWDAERGKQLVALQGVSRPEWSPDRSQILTYSSEDSTAGIWDAERGKQLVTLQSVSRAEWSPDGSQILTYSSEDDIIGIWDAVTGRQLVMLQGVSWPEWSPDGSKLYTHSSKDGMIRIWNVASGEQIVSLLYPDEDIWADSWSPDGSKLLTYSSEEEMIRVWNVEDGEQLVSHLYDDEDNWDVTWSQDGSQILIHNRTLNTVRIWNFKSGNEPITLQGVSEITWNQDESKLLIQKEDNSINIWDTESDEQLVVAQGVSSVEWSPDESQILTRDNDDGIFKVWYTNMTDLVDAACAKAARNMSFAEWSSFINESYRPTCNTAPIPPDAIEAITSEAKTHAQNGDLPAAATRLGQLVGWLRENGQFNTFGVERAAWLAVLESGENPWAGE